MDLKERAKKLKTDIPAVFIALKHKKTPLLAKILAGLWENGKPKKWYYALPIVIFWLLIIVLLAATFL